MKAIIKGEVSNDVIEFSLERNGGTGDIDLIAKIGCISNIVLSIDVNSMRYYLHELKNTAIMKSIAVDADDKIMKMGTP